MLLCSSVFAKENIKIVVPYSAGGTSDKVARHIQNYMNNSEYNFVVDNRPGAGGLVGATYVANEKTPTLLVSGQALVTNSVLGNAKYDLENDFTYLSCMIADPIVLVVKTDGPIKTFKDLLAANNAPYGISGPGTVQSILSPTIVNKDPKYIELTFKGSPETMNALLSDTITWYVDILNFVGPLVDSGKLKIIASTDRLKKYPDVPTFKELNIDIGSFKSKQLFVANSSIDPMLHRYIVKKLNEDGLKEVLRNNGFDHCINTNTSSGLKSEKELIKRLLK